MGRPNPSTPEENPAPNLTDLRAKLEALGVTIREKRGRLIVRGQPGYEHDNTVQALVARLQRAYAESPTEVAAPRARDKGPAARSTRSSRSSHRPTTRALSASGSTHPADSAAGSNPPANSSARAGSPRARRAPAAAIHCRGSDCPSRRRCCRIATCP